MASSRKAILYRMVMPKHVCPYGLKARALLRSKGYTVEDHWLTTQQETEAFKAAHGVTTTPQTFIDGKRVGGYDDLRRFFGKPVKDRNTVSYSPVLAVFAVTALMAIALSYANFGTPLTVRAAEWFIGLTMCVLAMLKLQDIESFSNMILNYDLLAQRWVGYSYLYPLAELSAGVLMVSGALTLLSAPIALLIGGIGAISVFKAVFIERRELKCACVGGASKVPLGFVSLTENLMMVVMAIWMLAMAAGSGPSTSGYMQGMSRMTKDMGAGLSGDADQDFVAMMIPHHQGAIDMAQTELKFGNDPVLQALANGIVTAQVKEIAEMRSWQVGHPHAGH